MIIGLTGGMGSGKSTALKALKNNGYFTVSCDDIVKELYSKRAVLKKLKKVFPSAISGRFKLKADKKEISRIVFSDKEKYRFLTDFLSVTAFNEALNRAKKAKNTAIVEVPLLLENDLTEYFDKVIVITRAINDRIKSVKVRSGLSEEEIKDRLKNQIDYETFDFSPYIVINNDGDEQSLAAAVLKAVKE